MNKDHITVLHLVFSPSHAQQQVTATQASFTKENTPVVASVLDSLLATL